MEHIIQQIAVELVENILKKALSEEIHNIDKLATEIEKDCKASAREIIQTVVSELNKRIRDDKTARKEQGLVLKEKDRARSLHTKLGILDIKRDYYYDKVKGTYTSILDGNLGVKKYERIGGEVSSLLVSLAADMSYAKSAKLASEEPISRQTVRNRILKIQVPEPKAREEVKKVKELHIYADEDHVHMQKPNKKRGKRNKIVPLVTVTEGTEKVGKGRNQTMEKVHFVDENCDGKSLWKSVEGYVLKNYDLKFLEKIYIHSDGGPWIKEGFADFAQRVRVMDGYHFGKAARAISSAFPNRNVRQNIEAIVKKADKKRADEYLHRLMENADDKQKEKLKEFAKYLLNNWEEILNLINLDMPGSCTEAQISHVLSERFSRDPLGWSDEGLGKLSVVRVYKVNGGKITGEMFVKKTEGTTYSKYVDEYLNEYFSKRLDWSIFDGEPTIFDGASGTQILMKNYGKLWS